MTESLLDLVHQDELTGLYNRRFLNTRLAELEARSPGERKEFALAIVDLDHFKAINDHYGHLEGDDLLKQVAAIYKRFESEQVIPIRYAGDEFVFLMDGLAKPRALEIAEEIREAIAAEEFLVSNEASLKITNSIGLAHFPSDVGDLRGVMEAADQAGLLAKRRGRNCVSTPADPGTDDLDKEALYRRFPCPRLVGRDDLLAVLQKTMPPRVVEARPLVVLEGEAGHGKTRLLRELKEAKHPERTLVLATRGASASTRQPFGLLCAALTRWAREEASALPLLAEALDDAQRAELASFMPMLSLYVTRARNDDGSEAPGPARLPGEKKQLLLSGFLAIFEALASRKSLALLLDDAHFADWGTVEVLRAFLERQSSRGTMVALGVRPGSDGLEGNAHLQALLEWASAGDIVTRLGVGPLGLDEVAEMVEGILPRLDRPLDLAVMLLGNSNGVPLFVEEILKYLIHRDIIRVEDGAVRLGDLRDEVLPSKVSEALRWRIDDLDEDVRSVLETASVLGAEFDVGRLSRVEGRNESEVLGLLEKARRQQFIRVDPTGSAEDERFDFPSPEGQEELYTSLDPGRRKTLHGQAARACDEMQPEGAELSVSEAAFHFQMAGDSDRATEYATRLVKLYTELAAPDEVLAWARLLPPKEWGLEAEFNDDDLRRAQKLARILKTSIQNFRLFPAHSEILTDIRDVAFAELSRLLEITETITFSEVEGIALINGREPAVGVFERNTVMDLLTFLGRSGLKAISFKRGVTEDQLFRFLGLLTMRPDEVKRQGGWTQILASEGLHEIVVNERLFVCVTERDLLEKARPEAAPPPARMEDPDVQDLVHLILTEGTALREQLLKSDVLRARLQQIARALESENEAPPESPSDDSAEQGPAPWLAAAGVSAPPVPAPQQVAAAPSVVEGMDLLGDIWEDTGVLLRELESGSRARANSATRSLLARGKDIAPTLKEFIKSSDDLRARRITLKLLERFEPEIRAWLLHEIEVTQVSDERIRLITLLDAYPGNDVLAVLAPSILAGQRELRREALQIVVSNDSGEAEGVLLRALSSDREDVLLDVIGALSRIGKAGAVDALAALIRPVNVLKEELFVEAQAEACAALGRMHHPDAIPALQAAVARRHQFSFWRTKPSPVRAAAAAALGVFSDSESRASLEIVSRDRDVSVRSVAKLALGGSLEGQEGDDQTREA